MLAELRKTTDEQITAQLADADQKAAALIADAEKQRADAEAALAAARQEADTAIAAQRAEADAYASRVTAEADAKLAEATERHTAATDFHERVAAQVTNAFSLLEEAKRHFTPAEEPKQPAKKASSTRNGTPANAGSR
ncbi:hypothetical protein GCM10023148_28020 [Actinokineospora soli]